MTISVAQTIKPVESKLQGNFEDADRVHLKGKKAFTMLAQIAEDVEGINHLLLTPESRSFTKRLASLIESGHHVKAQELINERANKVSSKALSEELEIALEKAYYASPSNAEAFENMPETKAWLQLKQDYGLQPTQPRAVLAA